MVAGTGEWIDAGGAQKAAQHVQQCVERCIPLVFVVHTPDPYARTALHLERAAASRFALCGVLLCSCYSSKYSTPIEDFKVAQKGFQYFSVLFCTRTFAVLIFEQLGVGSDWYE